MKKPTQKQLRTVAIKKNNPNLSTGEAMRRAGYSKSSAEAVTRNFAGLIGTQTALAQYQLSLEELKLTPARVAEKINEFIDAQKPFSSHTEPDKMIPDYQTQLKGVEMLRQDLGMSTTSEPSVNIQVNNLVNDKRREYEL